MPADAAATTRRDQAVAALADVPRTPGAPKPDPIVIADDVTRTFGGLTAVDVDHVEVQRGAITALIGPNGAGKTTFFNLLTGFDQPDKGRWSFNGRPLAGVPPHKVARMGMVRTFQLTKALSKLCLLYTSPSPRDRTRSRMPSSA
jgi:branched-chain amino acid transport system ATP-binding protein